MQMRMNSKLWSLYHQLKQENILMLQKWEIQ
jgi:hypothetical protein